MVLGPWPLQGAGIFALMANEQVTKTQVDTFSWEQEWDAGVVAELGESDLDLSDKALEVLYVSGDEWEEWGELPGQTSQSSLSLSRSEVQEDGPSGRGTPRMGSRGAVAALLHRDDTSAGRQRDAEIESRNLGIEREWHSLHRRVGAPGVSDSPEATIVLERRTPATKGAGGPPTSGASGPLSAEQEELLQYLGEWESYIREADDFMTSNEMALVTVIRQRTEEWVRKYAGLASPQECHSKVETQHPTAVAGMLALPGLCCHPLKS